MCATNLQECQAKYDQLLENLLKTSAQFVDDTYLVKIISHLSKEYADLLKSPSTLSFIDSSTREMHENPDKINPKICLFTLKLISYFAENESQFDSLKDKNILERVQTAVERNECVSLRLAHLNILKSATKHSSGLSWIKESEAWKFAIEYYEKCHTVYILRESADFLFNLLIKCSEVLLDDRQCEDIIQELLKPLLNYPWSGESNILLVDNQNDQRVFIPMLTMISTILEKCLQTGRRTRIAYFVLSAYRLEYNLWRLADITHDTDLLGIIVKNHVLGNFLRICSMDIPETDTTCKDLDFKVFTTHFYNHMTFLIGRKSFRTIIQTAELNHKLWKMLGDRAPSEEICDNDNKIKFGDQVLIIQVFPVLFLLKHRCAQENDGQYVEDFCTKILSISCTFTTRIMYSYRDALLANGSFDTIAELAGKSIQGMLSIKDSLKRDRAVLSCSILIYLLKEYVPDSKVMHENYAPEGKCKRKCGAVANSELLLQTQNLLFNILCGLHDLIKNYDISWKECIESTAIVDLMLALLNNPNLSTRLTVQALKLIQISIEHYLAPNLALLLNTLDGSGMENLGPIIAKRLHDSTWEVRDSALELLNAIVEMSELKYPAFQQHILDSNICPIIEQVIKHDSEAYVRASALKCLKTMIQIKLFWEGHFKTTDLLKYFIETLSSESEGIVRKESVACITAIYSHQQIPKSYLDMVFSTLVQLAVNDLFWEVKLNALYFWRVVICRQFQHQGMIDGVFPSVTFSKEHKKIVQLNEKEILLRLQKVLNELSMRGCLGVLLACLEDDSDLEVVKLAVFLVKKIMAHLTKYNYLKEFEKLKNGQSSSSKQHPKPIVDTNYSEFKKDLTEVTSQTRNNADFGETFRKNPENPVSFENLMETCCSDNVIESIVNLNDMGLLATAYKNNLKLSENNETGETNQKPQVVDDKLFKEFVKISGDDFIFAIKDINLDNLIELKTDWLLQSESFLSLLDDVLISFGYIKTGENEDNEMDCY